MCFLISFNMIYCESQRSGELPKEKLKGCWAELEERAHKGTRLTEFSLHCHLEPCLRATCTSRPPWTDLHLNCICSARCASPWTALYNCTWPAPTPDHSLVCLLSGALLTLTSVISTSQRSLWFYLFESGKNEITCLTLLRLVWYCFKVGKSVRRRRVSAGNKFINLNENNGKLINHTKVGSIWRDMNRLWTEFWGFWGELWQWNGHSGVETMLITCVTSVNTHVACHVAHVTCIACHTCVTCIACHTWRMYCMSHMAHVTHVSHVSHDMHILITLVAHVTLIHKRVT